MKTTVDTTDIANFWASTYFDSGNKDLVDASINSAYRDVQRTFWGIGKEPKTGQHQKTKIIVLDVVNELLDNEFTKPDDFDYWHRSNCEKLIEGHNNLYETKMAYGQAQKWINMSFKYLYALGENRIPKITKNYQFFHVPIDKIIQGELFNNYKIHKLKEAWSKIDYNTYINYQEAIRSNIEGIIPMDLDFKLWNKITINN